MTKKRNKLKHLINKRKLSQIQFFNMEPLKYVFNELCVLRTSQINNCAWKNKVESNDVLNKLASSAALCMSKTLMWGAISIQPLFAKVEITVEFGPVAKTFIYFHEQITARTSAAIRYKIMPPWCGLGDNQQSIKCKIYINLIL